MKRHSLKAENKEFQAPHVFPVCAFDDSVFCNQQCHRQNRSFVLCKNDSSYPSLGVVVSGFIFTPEGQVVIFDRSDGESSGPISGCVEMNEKWIFALSREIREETGLEVGVDRMIKADGEFVGLTPNSRRLIRIVPFAVFLPEYFDSERDIRLNGELSGFRILALREAAKFLSANALPETQKAFELITGY